MWLLIHAGWKYAGTSLQEDMEMMNLETQGLQHKQDQGHGHQQEQDQGQKKLHEVGISKLTSR